MSTENNVEPVIGVLSLQGNFEAHTKMLQSLGVQVQEVRTAAHLAKVQAHGDHAE